MFEKVRQRERWIIEKVRVRRKEKVGEREIIMFEKVRM